MEYVMGRDLAVKDFELQPPTPEISDRHARLRRERRIFLIEFR
jgi:hypothetical protein